jgi:hypothetical protein
MDDPWIRMDPDQRSKFLAAWHRAVVAYNAEMARALELEDHQAVTRIEERAAARIGEALATELATFLSPEQMRQLRGRVAFRSIMMALWRTHAIAEIR